MTLSWRLPWRAEWWWQRPCGREPGCPEPCCLALWVSSILLSPERAGTAETWVPVTGSWELGSVLSMDIGHPDAHRPWSDTVATCRPDAALQVQGFAALVRPGLGTDLVSRRPFPWVLMCCPRGVSRSQSPSPPRRPEGRLGLCPHCAPAPRLAWGSCWARQPWSPGPCCFVSPWDSDFSRRSRALWGVF